MNEINTGEASVNADSGEATTKPGAGSKSLPSRVMAVLSSYGLTCVILLFLMVLTYWGTRMQENHSLNNVVTQLFESWWCVLPLSEFGFYVDIRWPGAQFLLCLLAVNIICGGLVRINISRRNFGVVIIHLSILSLLLAGLVQQMFGTRGHMRLQHGEKSSQYNSFDEWELVIGEMRDDGSVKENLVSDAQLRRLPTIRSAGLPFEIAVTKYYRNSKLRMEKNPKAADHVGGVALVELPLDKMDTFNQPGAYVEVRVPDEKPLIGLLSAQQRYPWTVDVKGKKWFFDLRPRIFDLPFEIRLEKFRKEDHPGIDSPRHFSSDVVKLEDGVEQGFHISMNAPMRHGGFMFSQNNWGPQASEPAGPTYTVLEVSSNPADRWQMYVCIFVLIGMIWHFLNKLTAFFKKMTILIAKGVS